jgi:2Fe-2S ferredoxin
MKVTWKLGDGSEITAEVSNGMSMMEAALASNVTGIIGECGGTMSCATCHVFVDEAWYEKTGSPSDHEDAMLDVTEAERGPYSRLSCQIEASDALDGLVLIVPQA